MSIKLEDPQQARVETDRQANDYPLEATSLASNVISTLTYPPTSPEVPLDIRTQQNEEIRDALARGEIPQQLIDDLRLAPPDTDAQLEFERVGLGILKRYIPADFWDFDKNPVRLLIAADDAPNAIYLAGSNPPAIGLSRGMFREQKVMTYTKERFDHLTRGLSDMGLAPGGLAKPIDSVSAFVAVVMHELTHAKEERRRGSHANDKFEETLAYTEPLDAMHRAGLDARAMYKTMLILLRPLTNTEGVAQRLFDAHPLTDTTLNAIRLALTQLSYERGRITPLKQPDTDIDRMDVAELARLTSIASHQNWIDRALSSDYKKLAPAEQARQLVPLIDTLSEYEWSKAEEISVRIGAVAKRQKMAVTDAQEAVLRNVHRLDPSISVLLYEATHHKTTLHIPPPLLPLDEAMQDLVEACEQDSTSIADIERCSQRIVELVRTLPILQSGNGREFTCYQSLAHFEPAQRGQVVPWERLRAASLSSPVVAEAAVIIGFARDPVIAASIETHASIHERILSPKIWGEATFPYREVSWGPLIKTKERTMFLHQADFQPDPKAQGALVVRSIDGLEPDPYSFGTLPSAMARFHAAERRSVEITCSVLNRVPLTEDSSTEQIAFVKDRLSILRDAYAQDAYSPQPASIKPLAQVNPDLAFLTPTTLTRAPNAASEILLGHTKLARNQSQTEKNQNEVLEVLRRTVLATGSAEIIEGLGLSADHIVPEHAGAKSLSHLPLAKALLSDTLSVSPQVRLSYLGNELVNLISTNTDEQLVIGVLAKAGLLKSETLTLQDINTALKSNEVPWVGKFVLTRLALRELSDARDIPHLLLTLVNHEPERWSTNEFIKGRVLAYEPYMREELRELLATNKIVEAVQTFSTMNRQNLLSLTDRKTLIEDIAQNITRVDSPDLQLTLRLELIGGLLDEDYVAEATILAPVPSLIRQSLGTDDGSDRYQHNVLALISPLTNVASSKKRIDIRECLLRAMVAQRPLAQKITETLSNTKKVRDSDRMVGALGLDSLLFAIQQDYGVDQRKGLLQFLGQPWSQGSSLRFGKCITPPLPVTFLDTEDNRSRIQRPGPTRDLTKLISSYEVLLGATFNPPLFGKLRATEKTIVEEGAKTFLALTQAWHRQFSDCSLPMRTAIIHQLLFPDGLAIEEEPHIRQYVAETIAPPNAEHSNVIQRLTRRYLENTPFLKREPLLTGTIVAAWKVGPKATLGRTLVEVACSLGPAEVKTVQRMRGHNAVPENIRRDTATAVYRVGEPDRLPLLDWVDDIKEHLVQSYKNYLVSAGRSDESLILKNTGEVKGAGSMGVTVELSFSNGDSRILYLVRPFAKERGEAGFGTFQRMAQGMSEGDQSKDVLLDLLDSAQKRISLEASAPTAKAQYDIGIAMYRNKKALVGGSPFTFNAPEVVVAEEFKKHGKEYGYFLMEEVPGRPMVEFLLDSAITQERKRAVCAAIVAQEIHNYLHFLIEPDRNDGNIHIDGNTIHHLDLKAMRPEPWSDAAKEEVAPFLVNGLVDALKKEQNLAELLADIGGDRSQLSQEGFDLITELETGLMSLAPYINYLKTEDLQAIALGVLDAGIHPTLAKAASRSLPGGFVNLGEKFLRGERGFLIPSIPTVLDLMKLSQYKPLVGLVTLPTR
jgi:hypothetical protein